MRRVPSLNFCIAVAAASGACRAAPDARARPHITLPWLLTQLVPSPELVVDRADAHFGARWQLTPLLYSFGVHRAVSPWRSFVVDPIARQSGSMELYVSPEYLSIAPTLADRFGVRFGLRSTFPVLHRGEYLSVSVGSSVLQLAGETTAAYESGAFVLFGFVGALVTYSPTADGNRWIFTLNLRVF